MTNIEYCITRVTRKLTPEKFHVGPKPPFAKSVVKQPPHKPIVTPAPQKRQRPIRRRDFKSECPLCFRVLASATANGLLQVIRNHREQHRLTEKALQYGRKTSTVNSASPDVQKREESPE